MSSAKPTSSRRSRVAGCVVAARGSACRPGLLSNKRTAMPRRPSIHAHSKPTGPPPEINTRRSSFAITKLHATDCTRQAACFLSELPGDALAERFDVYAHSVCRVIGVVLADRFEHGLVLALKAAMMVRCRE